LSPLIQAVAIAACVAGGAEYTVVDAQGRVVGTLVTETPPASQMRIIGITRSTQIPAQPNRPADRTFRPDYSRALTVDQMIRAWHDDLDRINPPVVTGGG
jgi:hypothetical protein